MPNDISNVVDNELKDPEKRETLLRLGRLGLGAFAAYVGAGLFSERKAYAGSGNYSDSELQAMMSQPVDSILQGTRAVRVDDGNYQREVFGANQPVMVLFYNNLSEGSAGNATLAKVISEMFPQFKLCAYKITDGKENSYAERDRLKALYGIQKTPTILFFELKHGRIQNAGEDYNLHGGLSFGRVKSDIEYYKANCPKIL